jgi:hypothetical protein
MQPFQVNSYCTTRLLRLAAGASSASMTLSNGRWGFWGVCGRNGYDQAMAWEAASDAPATAFDLTDEKVRDLLDMSFGRYLADDLSFIPGGPVNVEAIESHILARLADRHWRKWIENSVRQVRSA